MYWYIFYKDQLLLQKQGEGYSVPCMCECPVRVEQTLPVEMPDGTRAMAAYTDEPLEETEAFLPSYSVRSTHPNRSPSCEQIISRNCSFSASEYRC